MLLRTVRDETAPGLDRNLLWLKLLDIPKFESPVRDPMGRRQKCGLTPPTARGELLTLTIDNTNAWHLMRCIMHKVPYPHPGEMLLEEFLKPMGITQYAVRVGGWLEWAVRRGHVQGSCPGRRPPPPRGAGPPHGPRKLLK